MTLLSEKTLFWVSLLAIGLVYFIFLPVSYDYDGTVFSQYLRYSLLEDNLRPVIQTHHLFYFPLNFLAYKALHQLTGYQVLEYFHLQLFSLLFGLLTLMMCYRIMRKIIPDPGFPLLGMWLLALTWGFWSYSVEAEVHMAGLFFVVGGVYFLFFKHPSPKNRILASLFLALSAGFHLTNILICFSVLFYFIQKRRSFGEALKFYLFYGIFILIPFLIYAVMTGQNLVSHFVNILFGDNLFSGYRISRWEGFSLQWSG